MGITPRQVDRLFISIYLQAIHLEISIQNISLVLSCEPQPNCRCWGSGQKTIIFPTYAMPKPKTYAMLMQVTEGYW